MNILELREMNYEQILNFCNTVNGGNSPYKEVAQSYKQRYEACLNDVVRIVSEYSPYMASKGYNELMELFKVYPLSALTNCITAYREGEFNNHDIYNFNCCEIKRFVDDCIFFSYRNSPEGQLAQAIEQFARLRGVYAEYLSYCSWVVRDTDNYIFRTQDNIVNMLRSGDKHELIAYLNSEESKMLLNGENTDYVLKLIQDVAAFCPRTCNIKLNFTQRRDDVERC